MPIIVSVQPFGIGRFALRIESGYRTGQFVSQGELKPADNEYPVLFSTEANAMQWAVDTGYQIFSVFDEIEPSVVTEEQFNSLLNRNATLVQEELNGIPVLDRSTGNVTFLKPKF